MEHHGTAVLDRGTRLGKYEIERLVGVGSMGAVYEGVHRETGQRFAIKVLNPVLAAVPAARLRFLKEAKLTERVSHPHIINVTDVGEDHGHSYLVMEMLEGADLSSRLDGFGSLSPAETVDIMLPVCDAVAEAHACGVTHRDLKPSNIFIAIRDGRPHPIVLDFGIAKDEDAASTWDTAGAGSARRPVFGTPYYLAPEQVIDHRAAGPASDQHALGVILYECLTGQPPYRGDSVEKLFRAIAAGKPIPPSTREPDLPEGLDAVVLRALETDPKKRFESVAELGHALRPFASKAAVAVAVPGAYQRKPSSPAIEIEAATPSPFRRTLTPEVETLSEPWFEAAEAQTPEDGADAVALPALESTTEPVQDAEPPLWTQPAPRKLAAKRIWIGAAAGAAMSVLALVVVATRGSSSAAHDPQPMPAAALVRAAPAAMEPTAAPPATPPPVTVPPPVPVPQPVAAVAEEPPPEPVAVPAVSRPPAPAPRAVPPAAAMARTRKPADRPRSRTNEGIRMHNGVPLLD